MVWAVETCKRRYLNVGLLVKFIIFRMAKCGMNLLCVTTLNYSVLAPLLLDA
jgi:hypothetical protein